MSVVSEFREFIDRGNVVDLAIAVVIGASFGQVVTSFVTNVLMPPIGMLLGRTDFSNLFVSLDGNSYPSLTIARAAGAPVVAYGTFLNSVIQFLIVAFAIFLVVKAIDAYRGGTAALRNCPYCDSKISTKAKRCPDCTTSLTDGPSITWAPEVPVEPPAKG